VVTKGKIEHGTVELGRWTLFDGTKIFLTWVPASQWVFLEDSNDVQ
jgi:hypothetical protein